jgi:hypothetical protein
MLKYFVLFSLYSRRLEAEGPQILFHLKSTDKYCLNLFNLSSNRYQTILWIESFDDRD